MDLRNRNGRSQWGGARVIRESVNYSIGQENAGTYAIVFASSSRWWIEESKMCREGHLALLRRVK